MLKGIFAACLFLFAEIAFATEFVVPNQTVVGVDKTYDSGEMIVLRISPLENPPSYLVDTKYQWLVINPDGSIKNNLIVWPDNTMVFFGAGVQRNTSKYVVIVNVTYLYLVKDDKGLVTEVAVRSAPIKFGYVTIKGINPDPEPGPNPPGPNPSPDPVFPHGKYGLAQLSYQWAKVIDVNSRQKGAAALASSYSSISSAIAAGTVRDLKEALAKVTESNRAALSQAGISAASWELYFTQLQDFTYNLYTANKLTTTDDARQAFLEIAEGLLSIK